MDVKNLPSCFPRAAQVWYRADGEALVADQKLYSELASWYPLLDPPGEHAEEAAFFGDRLSEAGDRPARTLLELGSGGGGNAVHLKARFEMTLVDRSPEMLAVSRALNPECEHVSGDMREARLGRLFDRVLIHDAICYMTTETDLRAAIRTAFDHCRAGGAALFAPDHVREHFRSSTDHGGFDSDGRRLRYLEWTHDPDPAGTTYAVDFAYLLQEGDGSPWTESERHVLGVFPRATWLALMAEVGFVPEVVIFNHSELPPDTYELFVGTKPR